MYTLCYGAFPGAAVGLESRFGILALTQHDLGHPFTEVVMCGGYSDPDPAGDDPWDVFLLDDETAEPEPQQGDFWGQPDQQELI